MYLPHAIALWALLTPSDMIVAILAPEFANTTHFDLNTCCSNPSLCLLSPRPPWDSATLSTPALSRRLKATAIGCDSDSRPTSDSNLIPEEAGFTAL